MSSIARKAFDDSAEDIKRLMEIHEKLGGAGAGRKFQLEVLNKSAIVLITAIWEAYIEDVLFEALENIIKNSESATKLPLELRKSISKELKDSKHELSVWEVADEEWRKLLQARFANLKKASEKQFNTPNSENVDTFVLKTLGIAQISNCWYWEAMSASNARRKLDHYVNLRHLIAHRNSPNQPVKKSDVIKYYWHVKRIVGKTGGEINKCVKGISGVPLWT